jgi:signal transduction histidine kinase
MNRFMKSLLLFGLLLSLSPVTAGDAAETALNSIKVGVLRDFPPQYSMSAEENPQGLAVDLIEAVAQKANLAIEYSIYSSWLELQEALKNKEIDLIPNMGIADSRKNWADFSIPMEVFPVSLFVRSSTQNLDSLEEFTNRRIGVVKFNIGEKIVTEHKYLLPVLFETIDNAILALLSGNIDGLIFPQPTLERILKNAHVEGQIIAVGIPLREMKRGMATFKGNEPLLEKLNQAATSVIASPEYQQIYTKWYGDQVSYWTVQRLIVSFTTLSILGFLMTFFWRYKSVTSLNKKLSISLEQLQKTEKELYEVNDKLEERVSLRTRELKQLHDELSLAHSELKTTQGQMLHQEKMASIGQLAAGVAHEINNPVGFVMSNLNTFGKYSERLKNYQTQADKILSSAQLDGAVISQLKQLRKKLKIDDVMEDLSDLVTESLDGTRRDSEIVQNLKSFSRVDDQELKTASVNDCLLSTLKVLHNELKYKVAVSADYGDLPEIKCRPGEINQVFMNLLVNAGNAIEDKGEIRIKTWHAEGTIFISIADNGHGIAAENLQHIFEPFFTTKDVGKGTGLGLSISYGIVEKHGGSIKVESVVGEGAVFTVELPVGEEFRQDKSQPGA